MTSIAIFERQIDELCALVEGEFDERRDVEAVRRAIRLARRDGGSLATFVREWQPSIARCAEAFLRVLELAEAQVTADELAHLDDYAQHRLGAIGAGHAAPSAGR
jgi:hypothetical protein